MVSVNNQLGSRQLLPSSLITLVAQLFHLHLMLQLVYSSLGDEKERTHAKKGKST
jgi:hypothetical protein